MRDREHGGEEDRFERWETESMEEKKTDLRDERWEAESMEKKIDLRDERQRVGRGGSWESKNGDLSLGLENMLFILVFFFFKS
jgi:hypothetical protein